MFDNLQPLLNNLALITCSLAIGASWVAAIVSPNLSFDKLTGARADGHVRELIHRSSPQLGFLMCRHGGALPGCRRPDCRHRRFRFSVRLLRHAHDAGAQAGQERSRRTHPAQGAAWHVSGVVPDVHGRRLDRRHLRLLVGLP
jgi:hypothetical protein